MSTEFTDDFPSGTPLGTYWDNIDGSSIWTVASNQLDYSGGNLYNDCLLCRNTTLSSVDQWVTVDLVNAGATETSLIWLRQDDTNVDIGYRLAITAARTTVRVVGGASNVIWEDTTHFNFTNGSTVSFAVEGTSATTIKFHVWKNLVGTPDNVTSYDTYSGDYGEITQSSGTEYDTGSYIGLGVNSSGSSALAWDTLSAGAYSPASAGISYDYRLIIS